MRHLKVRKRVRKRSRMTRKQKRKKKRKKERKPQFSWKRRRKKVQTTCIQMTADLKL